MGAQPDEGELELPPEYDDLVVAAARQVVRMELRRVLQGAANGGLVSPRVAALLGLIIDEPARAGG